jgi:hypothetical protein
MELLTLDSNYRPYELVERYGSLVWTERYSTVGDFQLVTTDVERMLKLLPLESLVTLRESTVPMLVELHKIEKGLTGAPTLTITGRSFESVLERRAAVKIDGSFDDEVPPPRELWLEQTRTPSDAAYNAIRQIIGDSETRDHLLPPYLLAPLGPQLPIVTLEDAMPMVNLTLPADYDRSDDDAQDYEIKPGDLYSAVKELLAANHHGLKAVRPAHGDSKISIEIYNGADLTNEVVFDARFDQFENSTYLLSFAGSANMAYVFTSSDSERVPKTQATEPEGLDRRVLYLDASSDAGVDKRTRGLIELYKNNVTALYDGKLSEQLETGYNNDYFLGDIIRLDGEYGLSETVRIAEFIRSEDSTGNKAYPTFEVITD